MLIIPGSKPQTVCAHDDERHTSWNLFGPCYAVRLCNVCVGSKEPVVEQDRRQVFAGIQLFA